MKQMTDEKTTNCDDCYGYHVGNAIRYGVVCKCKCHHPTPESVEGEWEKIFFDEFVCTNKLTTKLTISELKSFIRSLLDKQKKDWIGKIEGLRKKGHEPQCTIKEVDPEICGWCIGARNSYNRVLDDLLNLLK